MESEKEDFVTLTIRRYLASWWQKHAHQCDFHADIDHRWMRKRTAAAASNTDKMYYY